MNINEFMKQLKKSQAALSEKQAKLNKQSFSVNKQGVIIEVLGTKEIVKLNIDKELVDPEDVEALEILLKAALNEVFAKVDSAFKKLEAELSQGLPF